MTETTSVQAVNWPRSRESLAEDFYKIGLRAGMVLLVHSSLSQIGYVVGGPVTLIQALQDVLTPQGTLVMPAHTADYSDPAEWQNPPVPAEWHDHIRAVMPAFDPARTPTREMGAIPELFRTWPDVVRSSHPNVSFAAWGRHAAEVTADHSLAFSLGDNSPLANIYALDGHVLLLGVDHERNTSLHLGEFRAGVRAEVACGAPLLVNGRRQWTPYRDIDYNEDPFPQIGAALEAQGGVTFGQIGSARSRFFLQRTAVDFAEQWLLKTS